MMNINKLLVAEGLGSVLANVKALAAKNAQDVIEATAAWDTCEQDPHKVYNNTLNEKLKPYVDWALKYCIDNKYLDLHECYMSGLITHTDFLSKLVVEISTELYDNG